MSIELFRIYKITGDDVVNLGNKSGLDMVPLETAVRMLLNEGGYNRARLFKNCLLELTCEDEFGTVEERLNDLLAFVGPLPVGKVQDTLQLRLKKFDSRAHEFAERIGILEANGQTRTRAIEGIDRALNGSTQCFPSGVAERRVPGIVERLEQLEGERGRVVELANRVAELGSKIDNRPEADEEDAALAQTIREYVEGLDTDWPEQPLVGFVEQVRRDGVVGLMGDVKKAARRFSLPLFKRTIADLLRALDGLPFSPPEDRKVGKKKAKVVTLVDKVNNFVSRQYGEDYIGQQVATDEILFFTFWDDLQDDGDSDLYAELKSVLVGWGWVNKKGVAKLSPAKPNTIDDLVKRLQQEQESVSEDDPSPRRSLVLSDRIDNAFLDLFNSEDEDAEEVGRDEVSLKLFLKKLAKMKKSGPYEDLLQAIENEDVGDELGKKPTVDSLIKFLRSEGN